MAKKKLEEGVDYYYNERGLMVLTASFLKRRGYCCGSRCKHCPYSEEEFQEARARKRKFKLWM